LVFALVLAGALFDWNLLKPYAEHQLSEALGRTVSLAGNLTVTLSLTPRVHVEHVRVANPSWASEKEMLEADAVDLTIDLRRLWAGEYYLNDVTLTRPKLALEISPDGRRNWYLDREQKDQKSALRVGRLQVDTGDVVFHEPGKRTEIHAKVSTVDSAQRQAHVAFAATGTLNGLRLDATGSGGPVLALRDASAPYPIRFHATLGETQADVDGTVTGMTALSAADVRLALRGQNVADLYPLLQVTLPPTPPYDIVGHLRHEGKRLSFDQFRGRVGSSDLAGAIVVDLSGKTPSMTVAMTSNSLDLSDMGPLIGAHSKAATGKANERVLPDEPFNVERWDSMDMDVRFKATRLLHAAEMPLDNLTLHAVMKGGKLTLDPLNFGAVGGELATKMVLDSRSDPMQAEVSARVRKLQLNRVAPSIRLPNTTVGDISGDIELTGRGNSVARLLATADGRVAFAITDGEVSKQLMKLIGLDLGGYLWTKFTGDREVPIRCAVASFDAKHGVLDADALIFDTTDSILLGDGTIDFAKESLAMTIHAQPKKKSILSLRTPIYVTGTFHDPAVDVNKGELAARAGAAVGLGILNPLAALVPLIETGPGKDSDCAQLVASVRQPPSAATGQRAAHPPVMSKSAVESPKSTE
jgi:AsmA protein